SVRRAQLRALPQLLAVDARPARHWQDGRSEGNEDVQPEPDARGGDPHFLAAARPPAARYCRLGRWHLGRAPPLIADPYQPAAPAMGASEPVASAPGWSEYHPWKRPLAMNFRTTYILFGLLALVLIVFGIVFYFGPEQGTTGYVLPSVQGKTKVAASDIDTI